MLERVKTVFWKMIGILDILTYSPIWTNCDASLSIISGKHRDKKQSKSIVSGCQQWKVSQINLTLSHLQTHIDFIAAFLKHCGQKWNCPQCSQLYLTIKKKRTWPLPELPTFKSKAYFLPPVLTWENHELLTAIW